MKSSKTRCFNSFDLNQRYSIRQDPLNILLSCSYLGYGQSLLQHPLFLLFKQTLTAVLRLVAYLSLSLCVSFPLSICASSLNPEAIEQQEIARRAENLATAKHLLTQADKAVTALDYGSAYVLYLDALNKIPAGPLHSNERKATLGKLNRTAVRYAQWLIKNGHFDEAEKVLQSILIPENNSNYKPAIHLLFKLQHPSFYNKTVTPEFVADRHHTQQQLQKAKEHTEAGRFDLATKQFEEILAVNPYNHTAIQGMEETNRGRQTYYENAFEETRSRMMWEISKEWTLPPKHIPNAKQTTTSLDSHLNQTEELQTKLDQIIIPHIELKDVSLRDAVQFLSQQSQRLDTTSSELISSNGKGINIFLKLIPSTPMPATLHPDGQSDDTSSNSMPRALEPSDSRSDLSIVTPETRVTLSLNYVPLSEALRYLAALVGLKIKIEPYAVTLVPISEPIEKLITKEYRIPPGFIPPAKLNDQKATPQFTGLITPGPGIASRLNAQRFLEEQGIAFPSGATARYIPAGSKLVVRNTPDNIDLIDALVNAATGTPPTQVEIESKFIEITQNNLNELGFDWLLGPVSLPTSDNTVFTAGGQPLPIDTNSQYPFTQPNGIPVGSNSITQGLRSGNGGGPRSAVISNGLDALLATNSIGANIPAVGPALFAISGVLSNPQFQVIIRALNQKKGIDLMTAPKVTTKSGQKATVKIARRFSYPTQFDPPQIPQSTSIATGTNTSLQSTSLLLSTPPTITPSHPTAWAERDVGVTLSVEPIIGPDSYTIDLTLTPEVVDFDGFINYGSPITSIGRRLQGPFLTPVAQILTNNTINQPIFSTRRVTTNVSIWDGQTVALGGLIREDIQKVRDKVPILGDIPLAGSLFRTNIDQKIKRNLIIFVTARIIDAKGASIRRQEEEDTREQEDR